MRTHHYPSDITDAQWALIEPHIPPVYPGGRPRKTDVRDVLDAILYILRTGCPWTSHPRAPSGVTSTSGDETGPWRSSTTSFAARSARWRSPTTPERRRASGPRQCQERRRPETSYRGRQPGLAAGRAGDGRLRRRRGGGPRVVRPA